MVQVPSGIISALSHPPVKLLSRETLGPLTSGVYTLNRTRGPIAVDAFGITFSFFSIPAAFGYTDTTVRNYDDAICSWNVEQTMFDGHTVLTPEERVYHEGDLYFFNTLFPTTLHVWVQVGCTVIPYFLLAL